MLVNRSMSPGTFIPELGYPDVLHAAQWLSNAFGFSERLRIGTHRVQLTFGESSVVVFHADIPASLIPEKNHRIKVRVTGIDNHFEQAVRAGAIVHAPPTTHPYGERQYTVEDIGGHLWIFSESVADVHPQEWGGELLYSDTSTRTFYHGTRAELKPGNPTKSYRSREPLRVVVELLPYYCYVADRPALQYLNFLGERAHVQGICAVSRCGRHAF